MTNCKSKSISKAWNFSDTHDLKSLISKRRAMLYRLKTGLYVNDGITEEDAKNAIKFIETIIKTKKSGVSISTNDAAHTDECIGKQKHNKQTKSKEAECNNNDSYIGKTGFVFYFDEKLPCTVIDERRTSKGEIISLIIDFLSFENVRKTYSPFATDKKLIAPNMFHEYIISTQENKLII